jgi:hypothetical protein
MQVWETLLGALELRERIIIRNRQVSGSSALVGSRFYLVLQLRRAPWFWGRVLFLSLRKYQADSVALSGYFRQLLTGRELLLRMLIDRRDNEITNRCDLFLGMLGCASQSEVMN